MKRFLKVASALSVAVLLTGCIGESVQVPPAYVGKILSKDGFQPGLIKPSQFRLPFCVLYCDRLIVVESSDFGHVEQFRKDHALYMPKSQLAMPFDVRGTFAIRVPADYRQRKLRGLVHGFIGKQRIYNIYARPVIRDVVRRVVSKYSIEEVASSRAAIIWSRLAIWSPGWSHERPNGSSVVSSSVMSLA